MKWEKLDFCYCFDTFFPHAAYRGAAVPFAYPLGDDLYRVYYTARDHMNRSHIFCLELDLATLKIQKAQPEPLLFPGELGAFDDSGAMMSWLLKENDQYYLYYIGWNLGVTVPFRNAIGLAVSKDGIHFQRAFRGAIVDRSKDEPHFCSNSCVLKEAGLWRMWYLSCTGWFEQNGRVQHRYHIKYAQSQNGIDWERHGQIAIDYKDETEYAISRPSVLLENGIYKMWFSHRGETYRIGYAESPDGIHWTRKDEENEIDVSASGFDSEMIEYPYVFLHKGTKYMLFNGNAYGLTGFGLARCIEE